MLSISERTGAKAAVKVGAFLFLAWAILHIWVGFEGTRQYLTGDIRAVWHLILGGAKAPAEAFNYPTDAVTILAQRQLIENFVIDVAGYGVLGLVVAWGLWSRASRIAYLVGLVIIGIADMTFLFAMVLSGVVVFNFASLAGPIIWFLAVIITPFGLPALGRELR